VTQFLFCSTKSNASVLSLCPEWKTALCNKQQNLIWQEKNLDDQINPNSHCPLNTLSPCWLIMRYENLQAERRILKQKCKGFQDKLQALSDKENEEILEDKDPHGYNLVQNISSFFNNNDEDVYESIFTAVMTNMCESNKKTDEVITDDECEQCAEMASILLEQMKSISKKITKKEKGVRFSPCILHMAFSIYTHSKVGSYGIVLLMCCHQHLLLHILNQK